MFGEQKTCFCLNLGEAAKLLRDIFFSPSGEIIMEIFCGNNKKMRTMNNLQV